MCKELVYKVEHITFYIKCSKENLTVLSDWVKDQGTIIEICVGICSKVKTVSLNLRKIVMEAAFQMSIW